MWLEEQSELCPDGVKQQSNSRHHGQAFVLHIGPDTHLLHLYVTLIRSKIPPHTYYRNRLCLSPFLQIRGPHSILSPGLGQVHERRLRAATRQDLIMAIFLRARRTYWVLSCPGVDMGRCYHPNCSRQQ